MQKELEKLEGVKMDQLPALIAHMSSMLAEESARKVSVQKTVISSASEAFTAPAAAPTSESTTSNQMEVDNLPEPASDMAAVPPTVDTLSDFDRAKLEYLADIGAKLPANEAVGLVQGFIAGQITFMEAARLLPSVFLKHPVLIDRFSLLTNVFGQRALLKVLATATDRLLSYIQAIPIQLRRQACNEVADLILEHKLPKRTSETREFVYYACQGLVPEDVEIPQLSSMTDDQPDNEENSTHHSRARDESPPPVPAYKTPLSPSKSGLTTSHHSYGPSYTRRPGTYEHPRCSMRDDLGNEVLNDYFHCAGSGSEGSSQDNINNPHQDALFRLEEDALCVDILIGRAQSAVRVLEEISHRLAVLAAQRFVFFVNTQGENIKATNPQEVINGSLLAIHIDTFKVIAKNRTSVAIPDPLVLFYAEPQKFILEMTRLCMFQADEHVKIRRCFGKLWKHVFARQYIQTLDHRVYRMKNDDKHSYNPKAVMSMLNMQFYEALSSGRDCALDFLSSVDFMHLHHFLLPPATNTKSQRDKKKDQMDEQPMPNLLDPVTFESITNDAIQLIIAAGDRILSRSDHAEMATWLNETLRYLIRFPSAANWNTEPPQPSFPTVLCGPLQFYTVLKIFHTLHERLRLAYYISNQFSSNPWKFSQVVTPVPPSPAVPTSRLFPYFITTSEGKTPVTDSTFETKPPTPLTELSTLYTDSRPDYIATWEADAAPVARMTRAVAGSSTGHLLGGPPPSSNVVLQHTLLRQAAHLRNSPWDTRPGVTLLTTDTVPIAEDEASASLPPLPDPDLEVPSDQKYASFLQLLQDVLGGRIEANAFDLKLLKLLGQDAYVLYTTHRLITNLVSQIRLMMTMPDRHQWYDIWAEHTKTMISNPPHDQNTFHTHLEAYLILSQRAAGVHKFVEMRMSAMGVLSFKVHQPPAVNPNPTVTSNAIQWEAYVKSWNSSKLDGVDLVKRPVILRRNITSRLPEELRREPIQGMQPSWELATTLQQSRAQFHQGPPLFGVIHPTTYKLTREAFGDEWTLRKGRTSKNNNRPFPPPKSDETSPLHRVLFNLPKRSAPVLTAASAELELIDRIVKTEHDRADVIVTEPTNGDQISSRVRTKFRIPQSEDNMDVDANGLEEESEGDESESHASVVESISEDPAAAE